jgi:tyrosinase
MKMTVAKLNYRRKLAGLPLIRFDLRKLRAEDVQELRDAYAAMYEISDTAVGDSRGYIALARGHGYDQGLCHNDDRVFLTWHRAYLYAFEKALNTALQWKRGDQQLELTLPYWDWTVHDQTHDAANGIPRIVDDPTYIDAGGLTVANPLSRATSLFREISQGLRDEDRYTQRFPNNLAQSIPYLADDVARYLTNPSFTSFSEDLDGGAHGAVHVQVGGDMGQIISASYDPIFWLHHAMVDKIWYDWQVKNPNANVPLHVLQTPVYGGQPGSVYIHIEESLRYVYSSDSVQTAEDNNGTAADPARAVDDGTETEPAQDNAVKEIAAGMVTGPFSRAQLEFLQLHPPIKSYEIRAYINNPVCNADTGYDHQSFAGRLVLFGHGRCHGASGHCNPNLAARDEYDIRPKHPLRFEHTKYCLDVTRGLRRYMAGETKVNGVAFYLVTVDADGRQVSPAAVRYRGCNLRTF